MCRKQAVEMGWRQTSGARHHRQTEIVSTEVAMNVFDGCRHAVVR